MREVPVLTYTAAQVETEPAVILHGIKSVEDVLFFFDSRRGVFFLDGDVVVGVEFLVALTEPGESHLGGMASPFPAEV